MKNYSSSITNRPQTQPIFGRTDMVQNNAGGFSFEVTPQQRLERFLLIGSEGGTYYVDEQKLTEQNATAIIKYIKSDGAKALATVVDFAENNRAPKADATVFVLALIASHGDKETKIASYSAISKVCKTSTHLFMFLANIQNLRGWSKGLCKGVAKFYTGRTTDQVAYQLVKYRNRAGFTHADALSLSHPSKVSAELFKLFGYARGKVTPFESGNALVDAFEKAQSDVSTDELVGLIREYKLTWEMVPQEKLNTKEVLLALLENMPLTALIRNLNRFSYNDLTEGNTPTVKTIVSKLTDKENVQKSGIHPLNVVNSMLTYSSGRGVRGDKTWKVNQNIVDALGTTYDLALAALTPTNKNILLAVDISGSMRAPVNNMQMNASQIANVLAVTILKAEKNAELMWFDTNIQPAKLGRRNSIDEVLRNSPHGGGTDCAQAFVHALATKTKYDAIVILTDNETWAGNAHGLDLLNQYRRSVNRDVKVIELALAANPSTNLPVDEANVLRVVGFDASVTDLINTYLE
jgi:60 kDa SS-A/Ro ribonucleoprotein